MNYLRLAWAALVFGKPETLLSEVPGETLMQQLSLGGCGGQFRNWQIFHGHVRPTLMMLKNQKIWG